MSFHVTALLRYGGMRFPLAIGAVVVGVPTTAQTPLSGQISPVLRVVPKGTRVLLDVLIIKVCGKCDTLRYFRSECHASPI